MNTHRFCLSMTALALWTAALAPALRVARAQPAPPRRPGVIAPAPYDAVLRALPQVTAVHVREGWMGLSAIAPIEHQYDFERVPGGFRARTRCGVRGQSHTPPEVVLPEATVIDAVVRMGGIDVHGGTYQPVITHTDDYPSASITVETPAGAVTLATRSQGRYAPPWEITHPSGPHGIVSNREPGEAVAALVAAASGHECATWVQAVSARH